MKNLLILLLIFTCLNLSSQIEKPILKGNYIIGGSISMNYNHSDNSMTLNLSSSSSNPELEYINMNSSNFNLELSPQVGYFISNGLAIGISPIYVFSNPKETETSHDTASGPIFPLKSTTNTKTNSIGIGAFIKYYSKFGFFLNMKFQYQYDKSEITSELLEFSPGTSNISDRNETKTSRHSNTFAFSPGLGYAIFLNSYISLEPMISYSYSKSNESGNGTYNYIQSASGIKLNDNNSSKETIKQGGLFFTLGLNIFIK